MPIFGGPQGTQDPAKYLAADHGHPGDLGMDTIDIIQVVMTIEETFKLPEIADDDVAKFKTVADIIAYVENHSKR